ncbi:uncharacterized protein PpBr36_10459 [Pyricularia pennisetigena]|uniref:uncharacterized protein n=1 Tax=Pyricularia pennisetigena TaxID=1578925 RepID=UPI0011546834|nr:uncharacterized protein PpBr36_10459 [Pyricularia pennisetigena]TLS21145.1 hypothetical protein PpBr36_10459 [Pyricularia pennisetigena]
MKVYGIFIFALSLAVGVVAEVASDEVATDLSVRDVQMPYLDKRTMKLLRRKKSSSTSLSKKPKSTTNSKVGNICLVGTKFGQCRFDGSCNASDDNKRVAACI